MFFNHELHEKTRNDPQISQIFFNAEVSISDLFFCSTCLTSYKNSNIIINNHIPSQRCE